MKTICECGFTLMYSTKINSVECIRCNPEFFCFPNRYTKRDYEHSNNIPIEWKKRKKRGLCPVCGMQPNYIDDNRKIYCCQEHNDIYRSYTTEWNVLRKDIIKKKGRCAICGDTEENATLEADHIIALMNGGPMWEPKNIQILCNLCHKKKTIIDTKINQLFNNSK